MAYTVTLGPKANIFHDASTGITVARGEKVSLREQQYLSTRIRQALATGHLVLVPGDGNIPITSEEEVLKLDKRLKSKYKKGATIDKLAESVNMDQAQLLAKHNNVQVEPEDTVTSILEAILEES